MQWIGHLTYLLLVCQYLVRDMLQLRTLAIVASICSITYSFHREVFLVVKWNLVFLLVNVVQLTVLLYQRRPIAFSPEEQQLKETVFRAVDPVDLRRLLDLAEWRQVAPGEVLVREGQVLEHLTLVHQGRGVVKVQGEVVGEVKDGFFVGEMAYLSDAPASAVVEVTLPTRLLRWRRADLEGCLEARTGLRYAFQGILGADLLKKIRKMSGLATTAGNVPLSEITRTG